MVLTYAVTCSAHQAPLCDESALRFESHAGLDSCVLITTATVMYDTALT